MDSTHETKHEDGTKHPEVHDVQHEWSRDDEYPTSSTKDEEGLAILPSPENNNEEKGFPTGTTGKKLQSGSIESLLVAYFHLVNKLSLLFGMLCILEFT